MQGRYRKKNCLVGVNTMTEKPKSKSFREEVADMFVKSLEEDPQAIFKGWDFSETGVPLNISTNVEYRGLNVLWLKMIEITNGYGDPRWATFKQINAMDLKLKKGSKGTKVEYYLPIDDENNKAIKWDEYNKLSGQEKSSFYYDSYGLKKAKYVIRPRLFTVFNGSQVEGMPKLDIDITSNEINPSEIIKSISEGMEVPIESTFNSNKAYYSPAEDKIHLPCKEQFYSDEEYNRTALHELGHSTGHPSRLDRDQTGSFGSEKYAFEELVAEITSCFMSEYISEPISEEIMDKHKGYVQSWITAIKDDKNYLFRAIKAANKASDYMVEKGDLKKIKHKERSVDKQINKKNKKIR